MQFGDIIKAHRQRMGLTQEQLAQRLGTDRRTVSRWERGARVPVPRHLERLADVFGIDPDQLQPLARPRYARSAMSGVRRELLAEQPDLMQVELDPFGWRLDQAMRWRALDPWTAAQRLGIAPRTLRRWQTNGPPSWEALWRVAELVDLPVWWFRCGGEEEQEMYGPYELRGPDTGQPATVDSGWQFAEDVAARYELGVEDVIRTAYPIFSGWRWQDRLEQWRPRPVPPNPMTWRLQLAVARWGARRNEPLGTVSEDAITWITDVCSVTEATVRRWQDGSREPNWRHANLAAVALETPVFRLWAPSPELPALSKAT
jgi:transcriptional regulator with XRE-family HTH domain